MLSQPIPSDPLPVLLETQLELMEALIDLGRQQYSAIGRGRMAELVVLLRRRQQLSSRLRGSVLLGVPLGSQQSLALLTEPQRLALRQRHALAVARLGELLDQEKSCEQLLRQSREQISQRLRQGEPAQRVAAAYRRESSGDAPAARLDLCSSR
jgi:hypothetical protein